MNKSGGNPSAHFGVIWTCHPRRLQPLLSTITPSSSHLCIAYYTLGCNGPLVKLGSLVNYGTTPTHRVRSRNLALTDISTRSLSRFTQCQRLVRCVRYFQLTRLVHQPRVTQAPDLDLPSRSTRRYRLVLQLRYAQRRRTRSTPTVLSLRSTRSPWMVRSDTSTRSPWAIHSHSRRLVPHRRSPLELRLALSLRSPSETSASCFSAPQTIHYVRLDLVPRYCPLLDSFRQFGPHRVQRLAHSTWYTQQSRLTPTTRDTLGEGFAPQFRDARTQRLAPTNLVHSSRTTRSRTPGHSIN